RQRPADVQREGVQAAREPGLQGPGGRVQLQQARADLQGAPAGALEESAGDHGRVQRGVRRLAPPTPRRFRLLTAKGAAAEAPPPLPAGTAVSSLPARSSGSSSSSPSGLSAASPSGRTSTTMSSTTRLPRT